MIDGSADATAPAERMGVLAPDNFPMEVSPRCYVLNNFGDDGWELVAIHTNAQGGLVAFLKRPKAA